MFINLITQFRKLILVYCIICHFDLHLGVRATSFFFIFLFPIKNIIRLDRLYLSHNRKNSFLSLLSRWRRIWPFLYRASVFSVQFVVKLNTQVFVFCHHLYVQILDVHRCDLWCLPLEVDHHLLLFYWRLYAGGCVHTG